MYVANATEAPLMLKLSKILVSELSDIFGISIITLSGQQHSQGKKQKKHISNETVIKPRPVPFALLVWHNAAHADADSRTHQQGHRLSQQCAI